MFLTVFYLVFALYLGAILIHGIWRARSEAAALGVWAPLSPLDRAQNYQWMINVEELALSFQHMTEAFASSGRVIEQLARKINASVMEAVAELSPAQRAEYDRRVAGGEGKLDVLVALKKCRSRIL